METLLQDYLQDPLAQSAADAERATMEEARSSPVGGLLRPGATRKEGAKVRAAFTASLCDTVLIAGQAHDFFRCVRFCSVVCVLQYGSGDQHGDLLP